MGDPFEGLTDEGMIRTGVRADLIPPEFSPIVADLLDAFEEDRRPSWELHLYGSVATGLARVGHSDVDLVLVNGSAAWAQDVGAHLSQRYAHLCRGVEIGPAETSDYAGESDMAYGNRVFLRHYCVSLTGPSAVRPHESFPGDRRAARGFNGDIGAQLTRWRTEGATARRIARKTLFAMAGLVSVRTGTWTTDRSTAALLWVQQRRADLEGVSLLQWHARRTEELTPGEIRDLLSPDGVVAAVVDEFAAEIGLWSSD